MWQLSSKELFQILLVLVSKCKLFWWHWICWLYNSASSRIHCVTHIWNKTTSLIQQLSRRRMNSTSLVKHDSDETLSDRSDLNYDSEKEDLFDESQSRKTFRNEDLSFRRSMVCTMNGIFLRLYLLGIILASWYDSTFFKTEDKRKQIPIQGVWRYAHHREEDKKLWTLFWGFVLDFDESVEG